MDGPLEICKLICEKTGLKNPRNEEGITPLHNAAETGKFEICKLICQSIIAEDKNPKSNNGKTPIDFALEKKDLKLLYLLIEENNLQK